MSGELSRNTFGISSAESGTGEGFFCLLPTFNEIWVKEMAVLL